MHLVTVTWFQQEQELQEWQDIRAEQDKAFLESLEIDREKVSTHYY